MLQERSIAPFSFDLKDQGIAGPGGYIHISQNEFSYRKHVKQKEEDVAICNCKFDVCDPESACGEGCLNVLTSTECTPSFCPCGIYCKNQKFQRCEYAKTKLVKTEGRGWGLVADENIKGGQFIIEYCGEVISWKAAKRRTQMYASQGIKDAYIIALNAFESIDATRKGSLARFINHSWYDWMESWEKRGQPNCETRKWTVLGEIRVGIFAKHDLPIGTELAYDYNFEWYGGAKVRCLCGAAACSGFLGAKSRGFQEDTYNWEDDDDRFSIEKIPLYDSAEDEPSSSLLALDMAPADLENGDVQNSLLQKNSVVSEIPGGNTGQSNHVQSGAASKNKSRRLPKGRAKNLSQKEVDAKAVARSLADKEAQDEILMREETKIDASSNLESLYNEIRPAIEEHERDTQDSVPTSLAEKWIEANCSKMKAEFDLYFSIIKSVAFTPKRKHPDTEQPAKIEPNLLTNNSS